MALREESVESKSELFVRSELRAGRGGKQVALVVLHCLATSEGNNTPPATLPKRAA